MLTHSYYRPSDVGHQKYLILWSLLCQSLWHSDSWLSSNIWTTHTNMYCCRLQKQWTPLESEMIRKSSYVTTALKVWDILFFNTQYHILKESQRFRPGLIWAHQNQTQIERIPVIMSKLNRTQTQDRKTNKQKNHT